MKKNFVMIENLQNNFENDIQNPGKERIQIKCGYNNVQKLYENYF